MQDEIELVRRAQEGDAEALSRIYETNFDRIYRYVAIKVGERTEAEDITQQVFIKVLRSISSFRWKGTTFTAWLYRIAHNQVIDYLRKKGKQATVALNESLATDGIDPRVEVERGLEIERVAAAARKLTKAQQEVISLRFTSELSVAEVAEIMGKSEGAIKALQHSAILSLRKILAAE